MTPRAPAFALVGAAALAVLVLAGPAVPAVAAPAATCGQAVAQTRSDLESAGAPSSHTDWQGVRDDAQSFVDSHPYDGSGTRKLRADIDSLNANCAA
ncbi:hypothetical protein [Streptomyces sp. x-80]|jgi:hypothetical protein|uniref:hypothetical protein n=1 Tax=Streptomyces sp. x-80 TaxID=2789282 RepID=UPI0039812217